MIQGFEDHSPDLTDEDKNTARWIAKGLRKRLGKENAITNKEIRKKLREQDISVSGPKVRKMVQYIRVEGLASLLMATSEGYCIARSIEEFDEYLESFRQRTRSMMYTLEQLKLQRKYAEDRS